MAKTENTQKPAEVQSDHHERLVRIGMVNDIQKAGWKPYAGRFERNRSTREVIDFVEKNTPRSADEVFAGATKNISVAGRIMAFREHGKIAFANIQDASGELQICFKQDVLGTEKFAQIITLVNLGDFIGVSGEPFITKQGKLALLCADFSFLSKTLRPLPDKFHGLSDVEIRYRQRYLDLVANKETFERFVTRSKIVQGLREYLLKKDFLEIQTRTLQPQAGGAMAETFKTHHRALDTSFTLRIAPELDLKMAIAGGFERVFEFAINFRNEGIDPSHLQEFQMLEWYCAYENFETGMKWTEEMLRDVLTKATGKTVFTVYDKEDKAHDIDISKPFKRVTFAELLKTKGVDMFADKKTLLAQAKEFGLRVEELEKRSRANILDEIYKKTIRPTLVEPIFVTHYPADLVPLARTLDEDPRIAESYQLLVSGWEIVKGYSELVDPIKQRKAFEDQAKAKKEGDVEAMEVNEEYLTAMEHGMPPVTGFGMGIERLVTLFTGQKNLRDVVLFPLMKNEDVSNKKTPVATPEKSKKLSSGTKFINKLFRKK